MRLMKKNTASVPKKIYPTRQSISRIGDRRLSAALFPGGRINDSFSDFSCKKSAAARLSIFSEQTLLQPSSPKYSQGKQVVRMQAWQRTFFPSDLRTGRVSPVFSGTRRLSRSQRLWRSRLHSNSRRSSAGLLQSRRTSAGLSRLPRVSLQGIRSGQTES